jgi:hypothetical protein
MFTDETLDGDRNDKASASLSNFSSKEGALLERHLLLRAQRTPAMGRRR